MRGLLITMVALVSFAALSGCTPPECDVGYVEVSGTCVRDPEVCIGDECPGPDMCTPEAPVYLSESELCVECAAPSDCSASENNNASCEANKCVFACVDGYDDCDENPQNGCETETGSKAHCGGCQMACALDELCVSESCEAIRIEQVSTFGLDNHAILEDGSVLGLGRTETAYEYDGVALGVEGEPAWVIGRRRPGGPLDWHHRYLLGANGNGPTHLLVDEARNRVYLFGKNTGAFSVGPYSVPAFSIFAIAYDLTTGARVWWDYQPSGVGAPFAGIDDDGALWIRKPDGSCNTDGCIAFYKYPFDKGEATSIEWQLPFTDVSLHDAATGLYAVGKSSEALDQMLDPFEHNGPESRWVARMNWDAKIEWARHAEGSFHLIEPLANELALGVTLSESGHVGPLDVTVDTLEYGRFVHMRIGAADGGVLGSWEVPNTFARVVTPLAAQWDGGLLLLLTQHEDTTLGGWTFSYTSTTPRNRVVSVNKSGLVRWALDRNDIAGTLRVHHELREIFAFQFSRQYSVLEP